MMKSEYRRNGRVIVRRGLALSLGLWLALVVGALPQPALAAFNPTAANTISWFYTAAFGRTPVPNSELPDNGDLGGLTFWTDAYLVGEGDLAQFNQNVYAIADFFVASDEFQEKFPDALTNEAFVTALYENMLGREPDEEGRAFWTAKLAVDSRGTVLADFTNTQENRDSNPARKAALASFIDFINDHPDHTIMPAEAGTWLAANSNLDAATVDTTFVLAVIKAGNGSGIIASNPGIPTGITCGSTCRTNFRSDESVSLTATANADSQFAGWTPAPCAASFPMPANNLTCTATFTLNRYTVTATAGANGAISPPSQTVNHGATTTFTVTPNSGYITADVTGCDGTLSENTYTTGPITGACTVTATFTDRIAQPTFAPPPGTYPPREEITVTGPAGATLFYTQDHRIEPTCTGGGVPLPSGSVSLDWTPMTLQVIACVGNNASPVTTGVYTITGESAKHQAIGPDGPTDLVGFNGSGMKSCAAGQTAELPCPVISYPGQYGIFLGQDAEYGRDVLARQNQLPKVGGGDGGFDFTKISNSGVELTAEAELGSGPDDWGCTRDNVTGLWWEVKTDEPGTLRHYNNIYTWYNPDPATNGGEPGCRNGRQPSSTTDLCTDPPRNPRSVPPLCSGSECLCHGSECDSHAYEQAVRAQGGMCGRTDWRIPKAAELASLAHYGYRIPAIDTDYFPNTLGQGYSAYWAAERWVGGIRMAWNVTGHGTVWWFGDFNFAHVRLVSSGATPPFVTDAHCTNARTSATTPTADFSVHGDGTVTHQKTGLMWTQCLLSVQAGGSVCGGHRPSAYNWPDALQAVAQLNKDAGFAGHRDWRLPNLKELASIVERCRHDPSLNPTIFPNTTSPMWSSTPTMGNAAGAWIVKNWDGTTILGSKSSQYLIRMVRNP